jgi:hypothetical protein
MAGDVSGFQSLSKEENYIEEIFSSNVGRIIRS